MKSGPRNSEAVKASAYSVIMLMIVPWGPICSTQKSLLGWLTASSRRSAKAFTTFVAAGLKAAAAHPHPRSDKEAPPSPREPRKKMERGEGHAARGGGTGTNS